MGLTVDNLRMIVNPLISAVAFDETADITIENDKIIITGTRALVKSYSGSDTVLKITIEEVKKDVTTDTTDAAVHEDGTNEKTADETGNDQAGGTQDSTNASSGTASGDNASGD